MRYHFLASLCIASLALVANPAAAQKREYSPGLNYTTLGADQKEKTDNDAAEEKKPERPKLYNTVQPKPAQNAEPTDDLAKGTEQPQEDPVEEDPTVTIWNKYKDLASGTAGEQGEEEGATKEAVKTLTPKKPDRPSVETPATPGTAPAADAIEGEEKPVQNAFGSILDQWKASREQKRDMRSKTFAVPDTKSN